MSGQSGRRHAWLVLLFCAALLRPGLLVAGEPAPEPASVQGSGGSTPTPDLDPVLALKPGALVRVRSDLSEDRLKGTIRTLCVDGIIVADRKGWETTVPWSTIQYLDVQVGVHHAYGKAAIFGGFAGALAGVLVANTKEPCFAPGCPDEKTGNANQYALAGGAFGALLAVCAEGLSKPAWPTWSRVPLPIRPPPDAPAPAPPPSVRFGIAPQRGGLAAGWVFAF